MSYKDATAFAASLAATLMVSIVVFQAGDGTHGAMPSDEYDGDEDPRRLGNRPLAVRRASASLSPPGALHQRARPGKRHRTEGSGKGEVEGGAGRASPLRQRESGGGLVCNHLSLEIPK